MADLITVRSTLEPGRVSLFEQDERHPNGEVFINDTEPHQVARTHFVIQRLRNGILVEVGAEPEAETQASAEPWASYDDMTAAEIVAGLSHVSAETRAAVHAYESEHKARATVLNAIEQESPDAFS